ncbi:MAG: histidine kinase [Pseudomonadota bacterium]
MRQYVNPLLLCSIALTLLLAGDRGGASEPVLPTQCEQRLDTDPSVVEGRSWRARDRRLQRVECLVTLTSEHTADEPLGIFLSGTFSARVWWDDVELGAKGKPAADRAGEVPGLLSAVMFLPRGLLSPGNHKLAIEWSSHYARGTATPLDTLRLGPYRDPLYAQRTAYLPAMLTVGTLVLAFTYLVLLGVRTGDRPSIWLAAACLALLVQLAFEVMRAYVNYPYPWHTIRLTAVTVAAALATISLLAYLCERFRRRTWWIWAVVPIGLLSSFAVSSADSVTFLIIAFGVLAGIVVTTQARLSGDRSAQPAVFGLIIAAALLLLNAPAFLDLGVYLGYALLLLVLFAEQVKILTRQREAKQQAELTSARLRVELLKRNLNPHFLMNTLTTLSEWIETSPRKGVAMITALSQEFRHLADMAEASLVPLTREIELCRRHLDVMGYRHDRHYALVVDGSPHGETIPPAILHTLVENALTHGRYTGDTTLHLSLHRQEGMLNTQLTAPPGQPGDRDTVTHGTGTRYIEARLEEAYATRWSLCAGPTPEGGWQTQIRFPALGE